MAEGICTLPSTPMAMLSVKSEISPINKAKIVDHGKWHTTAPGHVEISWDMWKETGDYVCASSSTSAEALCETDSNQVAPCADPQFHNSPHLRYIEGCTNVAPMKVVKWGDNTFVCSGNQHRKSPYD